MTHCQVGIETERYVLDYAKYEFHYDNDNLNRRNSSQHRIVDFSRSATVGKGVQSAIGNFVNGHVAYRTPSCIAWLFWKGIHIANDDSVYSD